VGKTVSLRFRKGAGGDACGTALAINMCFLRKRWVQPEEWAQLIADELGLKYAEFTSDLLDPFFVPEPARSRIAERTRTAFAERGIKIIDYYTGVITHCLNLLSHPEPQIRETGMKWCREAILLAEKIGADGIGGHFDTIVDAECRDPKRRAERIDGVIRSFQSLSRDAKEHGLKFLLWEQMYTPSEASYTIAEAKDIYERVNEDAAVPIYLTIDVGHACNLHYPHSEEDLDPYRWLEKFAHISPVIHLQQTDEKVSHHWPFTDHYNKIGIIHPEKVLEAIEKSGSERNYLVFEIFHSLGATEETVLDNLKRSVAYWRRWVAE
jgi:sugar phosphate isomerase/epimerase